MRSILESNAPWDGIEVPRCDIPGMLTDSEKNTIAILLRFTRAGARKSSWGPG